MKKYKLYTWKDTLFEIFVKAGIALIFIGLLVILFLGYLLIAQ